MPRDNFPAKVVERLRARVAHRCSNPDCRVPTVGPGEGLLNVASIGKAAHITAAAPGGPRYDPTMGASERASIKNAIWLCSNCATKIDVDEASYPVTSLHEWKRLAEAAADQEKGKIPPHPDDARNQLVSALTGLPTSFVGTAIQNTHHAAEQVLNGIDPRFFLKTSYANNTTTYSVHALEDVNFKIVVPSPLTKEWCAAIEALIDHGQSVNMPAAGVRLEGSPLFEKMFSGVELQNAHFSLECNKRPAALKLTLIDPVTCQVEQFDDGLGNVSIGRKSLMYEGIACNGLLDLSFTLNWEQPNESTTFGIAVNFGRWEGHDLRFLPYFDKLFRLLSLLVSQWNLNASLEIEGLPVGQGTAQISSKEDAFKSIHWLLRYIDLARKIAVYVGKPVLLAADYKISESEFRHLMDVVDTIEGKRSFDKASVRSNPMCHLVAQNGASNIRLLAGHKEAMAIKMIVDEAEPVIVFGQKVQMPKTTLELTGVSPRVHHPDVPAICDGDDVLVEWEPADGFCLAFRYLKDEEIFAYPPKG